MSQRKSKLITISLPPELLDKAEELAREEDRTRSGLFREAIRRYLWDRQLDREKRKAEPKNNLSY